MTVLLSPEAQVGNHAQTALPQYAFAEPLPARHLDDSAPHALHEDAKEEGALVRPFFDEIDLD